MCGQSGRVTQRCHNSPHWKWGYGVRVMSCTGRARRILGDFEKVSELRWDLPRGKTVGFRLLVKTFVAGATCVGGGGANEKARIERLCLSPYVETFNSKVIKGFIPELRSHCVFFEFWDSYVLSFWTFDVRFTHSHIMAMVQKYSYVNSFPVLLSFMTQDLRFSL